MIDALRGREKDAEAEPIVHRRISLLMSPVLSHRIAVAQGEFVGAVFVVWMMPRALSVLAELILIFGLSTLAGLELEFG